jgi:hypothetical protein
MILLRETDLLFLATALILLGGVAGACSSLSRHSCSMPGAVRCGDTRVELCAPDGVWIEVQDCRDLEPGEWTCSAPLGCVEVLP